MSSAAPSLIVAAVTRYNGLVIGFPGPWTFLRGAVTLTLGSSRVVMRGPMFPNVTRLGDGTLLVSAAESSEHSRTMTIRSVDGGDTWQPWSPALPTGAQHAALELSDGRVLAIAHVTRATGARAFALRRWDSSDGWRTVRGPIDDAVLRWPESLPVPAGTPAFYGNLVEAAPGELLAGVQARGADGRFRVALARSVDGGRNWEVQAEVASLESIDDPAGLTRCGWSLHGPCEPALSRLADGTLICVMRLVDDDVAPRTTPLQETYRDLLSDAPGDAVHPGNAYPPDRWFAPGPSSVPMVCARSGDNGRTWTRAVPIAPPRGCYPRLAVDGDVLVAVYGALGFPRRGNAVCVSTDGGRSWCEEVQFSPYLTTGYADVVNVGPGRFCIVYDVTPPQPWKDHAAHWVGAIDLEVRVPS